jgi:methionyl-tRNA formyltransferase
MNVVFFGTSEFAVPVLQAVHASQHELAGVVTTPDRPKGRGRRMTASYGKEEALRLSVPVLTPEKLDKAFAEAVRDLQPDIGVVASYGKIIGQNVLDLPPQGMINVHPSLLPRYRGPSPIQQPILNGDEVTGVTIIKLTAEMDAGPILLQREVELEVDETAGRLHDRLAALGGKLAVKALDMIGKGKAEFVDQDDSQATYCRKIDKSDACIRWEQPAEHVMRQIRAMTPWPGAYTFSAADGRRLKVARAEESRGHSSAAAPGTVVEASDTAGLVIACAEGAVRIAELAPEGGRKMTSEEFARGRKLAAGDRLVAEP